MNTSAGCFDIKKSITLQQKKIGRLFCRETYNFLKSYILLPLPVIQEVRFLAWNYWISISIFIESIFKVIFGLFWKGFSILKTLERRRTFNRILQCDLTQKSLRLRWIPVVLMSFGKEMRVIWPQSRWFKKPCWSLERWGRAETKWSRVLWVLVTEVVKVV